MESLVILQARTGSTRLPNKVLLPINNRPMIEWQIRRIQLANVGEMVLATTDDRDDDVLASIGKELGVEVYRGSKDDVASRFSQILEIHKPNYFFRLTGDCPLIMPQILVEMRQKFNSQGSLEYLSNTLVNTFPDGLDAEIIKTATFREYYELGLNDLEREHVTIGIYSRPDIYTVENFSWGLDLGSRRWTVDYFEDYEFVRDIFSKFVGREEEIEIQDVLKLIESGEIRENKIPHTFRNIKIRK